MEFVSTRSTGVRASLGEAIERGLAPDGGLYVPSAFPRLEIEYLEVARSIAGLAERMLFPFFEGDELLDELPSICEEAFNFPVILKDLHRRTAVLELFHGPTAAFKDFGARFLAATMARLQKNTSRPLTVLVATSGDTGGAVAAAFAGRPGFEVVVLYPEGMVSPRQEQQLTCWGGNVRALRVHGDFDACQRLAKEAFQDAELRERLRLTSANSISLGRLLPQMVYYAAASLEYQRRHGVPAGFVVPSGNLGNVTACFWAQRLGLPIRDIVLATNANPTLSRFVADHVWRPYPTVATLATAMDVGNPSNIERLVHLHGGEGDTCASLTVSLVTDDQIREQIAQGIDLWGETWDPHTATAVAVRERLESPDWVMVSTAHPAKFEGVVEPLIGREIPVPPALAELLDRPSHYKEIEPQLDALRSALS